jgi:hypothetical protein
MERLVRKLSRMRGAALKLGQMISIQGTKTQTTFISSNPILFSRFKFVASTYS